MNSHFDPLLDGSIVASISCLEAVLSIRPGERRLPAAVKMMIGLHPRCCFRHPPLGARAGSHVAEDIRRVGRNWKLRREAVSKRRRRAPPHKPVAQAFGKSSISVSPRLDRPRRFMGLPVLRYCAPLGKERSPCESTHRAPCFARNPCSPLTLASCDEDATAVEGMTRLRRSRNERSATWIS